MKKILLVIIALIITGITLRLDWDRFELFAKEIPCTEIQAKFHESIQSCYEINGNYVCYGTESAQVEPEPYRFYELKDRRPLPDLEEVFTQDDNGDDNGVVILDLHLPGIQPIVRAVLFGSVSVKVEDSRQHIFRMRKTDAGYVCAATPPGMVVRTESGTAGQVTVNGVTILLRSSVFITMESSDRMTITNLEGQVTLDNGIETLELPEGYQIGVQLNGQPAFLPPPIPSEFFNSEALQWLITNENGMKRIQNTNENPATADACVHQIEFGIPITEQNINPGHECLFKFCAKKGDMITARMEALDSNLNPWLDLRGPDEKIVSFNNDIDRTDQDSLICNVGLPVDGCYTLVARAHHNDSFGQFRVRLDRQSACMPPPSTCVGLHPEDRDCPTPKPRTCTKIITRSLPTPSVSPLPTPVTFTEEIVVPCEDAGT